MKWKKIKEMVTEEKKTLAIYASVIFVILAISCGDRFTNAATTISTTAIAVIAVIGACFAKKQLDQLNETRTEQFIESLNSKIDSEKMRKDRRNIYKKFRPPHPDQLLKIEDEDLNMMERVWNYLDAIGFLMVQNGQLMETGLKLWSWNFCRCWLCMNPFIFEQRKNRGNEHFMEYFEILYNKSASHLKKEYGIDPEKDLKWY